MVNGGDGIGTGPSFQFGSCLQRIPASDIEVVDIVDDGTYQIADRSHR
jgi:hypothetical protein